MPQTQSGAVDMLTAIFTGTRYLGLRTASGEVVGSGYARLAIAAAQRGQNSTTGEVTITVAMNFANPTTSAWGDVMYLSVYTASTGGVEKWRARIVNSSGSNVTLSVAVGDRVFFAANQLRFRANNSVVV